MNAALEPARRRLLTVAEYHRMGETGILGPDETVELIDGEIIAMPPVGSTHAGFVDQLNHLLTHAVGDRGIVRVQNPVRLSDLSEPEPDLALLRPRRDFYRNAHPTPADTLLVIEVSNTTLDHDREVKIPLYARHGIIEVWLLDVRASTMHVHRGPIDGRYAHERVTSLSTTLDIAGLAGVSVDLAPLLATT